MVRAADEFSLPDLEVEIREGANLDLAHSIDLGQAACNEYARGDVPDVGRLYPH